MTEPQAAKLVTLLLAAYPRQAAEFTEATSQVYERYLADLEYTEVDIAVRALIAESKWLPTVAEIRNRVAANVLGDRSPELAWEDVRREIRRIGIYGTPSFEDPFTAAAVASLGWRSVCDSKSGDWVVRSQFIRAYQAALDRAKREQNTGRLLRDVSRKRLAGGEQK